MRLGSARPPLEPACRIRGLFTSPNPRNLDPVQGGGKEAGATPPPPALPATAKGDLLPLGSARAAEIAVSSAGALHAHAQSLAGTGSVPALAVHVGGEEGGGA